MASPLGNNNKENKNSSIINKSVNNNSASKISSSEIINAAIRMIVKRESNNNMSKLFSNATNNSHNKNEVASLIQETNVGSFKDIKNKFENLSNSRNQVPLTPKSIIKKVYNILLIKTSNIWNKKKENKDCV